MAQRLSPRFLELAHYAAWKSFWRKHALKTFLRRCGVPETLLSQLSDAKEVSKQNWLDFLFPILEKSDSGQQILQQMGRALAEQTTFPDLDKWENSDVLVADAKKAVRDLKAFLDKVD